eukprot:2041638-Amphidinium_carterae.1
MDVTVWTTFKFLAARKGACTSGGDSTQRTPRRRQIELCRTTGVLIVPARFHLLPPFLENFKRLYFFNSFPWAVDNIVRRFQ